MLNIPYPLPDELVCSVIARAQRRLGIHGPKFANEYLLKNRNIIATPDLPAQLGLFSRQLEYQTVTPTDLAYKHTLLPLYAPFITEERRLKSLQWMEGKCRGNVHFITGCAASRLHKLEFMRYCPHCAQEQIEEHGEAYWARHHQIPSLDHCIKHQTPLRSIKRRVQKTNRHSFWQLEVNDGDDICADDSNSINEQVRISRQVSILLNLKPSASASHEQWTQFYQNTLYEKGYTKGRYIYFDKLKDKVSANWPVIWLKKENLWPLENQSSWLHAITRKHRKSFSFLEHIVFLDAIFERSWSIDTVLKQVPLARANPSKTHVYTNPVNDSLVHAYKSQWLTMVKKYGAKLARSNGGDAIYTWLYRYHKKWLLKTNRHFRLPVHCIDRRVDWQARDWHIVRSMYRALYNSEGHLDCARRSRLWFFHQQEMSYTIEKNLAKLPLTAAFLDRYAEDTTEYQIRRITRTIARSYPNDLPMWQLLRKSGLSGERITSLAQTFLHRIATNH